MTLQWISIILGLLAVSGGLIGILRPDLIRRFAELFPRSVVPAWILTALCCWLGAKEALSMTPALSKESHHLVDEYAILKMSELNHTEPDRVDPVGSYELIGDEATVQFAR